MVDFNRRHLELREQEELELDKVQDEFNDAEWALRERRHAIWYEHDGQTLENMTSEEFRAWEKDRDNRLMLLDKEEFQLRRDWEKSDNQIRRKYRRLFDQLLEKSNKDAEKEALENAAKWKEETEEQMTAFRKSIETHQEKEQKKGSGALGVAVSVIGGYFLGKQLGKWLTSGITRGGKVKKY